MKLSELFEKTNPDYFKSLRPAEKELMRKEIKRFGSMPHDNPAAYPADWVADKKFKERRRRPIPTSKFTDRYHAMFDSQVNESAVDSALKNKALQTGLPVKILRSVFDRGAAAWRTGHRPGVSQVQWAMARVNSFIVGGPAREADRDLWDQVK